MNTASRAFYYGVGLWYGYPECCIESFIDRVDRIQQGLPVVASSVMQDTGFIPCVLCAVTYTDEELEAQIKAKRECPFPFPQDEEDESRQPPDVLQADRPHSSPD